MKRRISCYILLCFFYCSSFAQGVQYRCPECSMDEAKKIQRDMQHIQEARFYCFLHSFSVGKCLNNTEYLQFANPLLFDLLQNNSGALLNMLKKYPELYSEKLHKQLQTPLLDFNMNRVIFMFDSANGKSKIKKKVLEDLESVNVDDRGYPR